MSKKSSVNIGNIYGNLIVTKPNSSYYFEPSGSKLWKSFFKCICGNEFETRNFNLTRGQSNKCPDCVSMARTSAKCVKIGDKFDNLTIIGFTRIYCKSENGRLIAVCKCICGNEKNIRIDNLTSTNTHSCGCMPPAHCMKTGKIYRCFFNEIKAKAKAREIKFNLSIDDIWKIYEKQNGKCALSGVEIKFANKAKLPNTASLDRIDSSKHYTIENIQWVHKDVNRMKMDMSQDEFINYCKIIAKYNS
jgi:hypothetical protein